MNHFILIEMKLKLLVIALCAIVTIIVAGILYFIVSILILFGLAFYPLPKDCVTKRTTNPRHLNKLIKTKKCRGCKLGDANLSQLDLEGADLRGALLVNAVLNNANLQNANLQNAEFAWYDTYHGWGSTNSCQVELSASLIEVNLKSANLSDANLL